MRQYKLDLSGIPKEHNTIEYQRRKWRKAMQEYCDQMANVVGEVDGYCRCGHMEYCDYCQDPAIKNACVNAMTKLCKKRKIEINYEDFRFTKFIERIEKR